MYERCIHVTERLRMFCKRVLRIIFGSKRDKLREICRKWITTNVVIFIFCQIYLGKSIQGSSDAHDI
jgi:hypothetical protein